MKTLPPVQLLTIINYFKTQPVLKAYLFSSYSQGEETGQSNFDLLVELECKQNVRWAFIGLHLDLQQLPGRKVDVVSANGLSKYMEPIIEKEKKLSYERS